MPITRLERLGRLEQKACLSSAGMHFVLAQDPEEENPNTVRTYCAMMPRSQVLLLKVMKSS